MVFALVLLAIPLLYVVAHVILVRTGEDCGTSLRSEVGGLVQMVVPGNGCTQRPGGR
jgi:hypothetical protein